MNSQWATDSCAAVHRPPTWPGQSSPRGAVDSAAGAGGPRLRVVQAPASVPWKAQLQAWRQEMRQGPPMVWPCLVLLVGTCFFRWTSADLEISSWFFRAGCGGFNEQLMPPWTFLYHYGELPALILGIGGLLVAALGWVHERLRPLRYGGLYLGLLVLLGPGLVINVALKDSWGRPRPFESQPFEGDHPFLQLGEIGNEITKNSSFPSGHAAMGFALMGPAFVLTRRYPRQARWFWILGLAAGLTIGTGRVVQGRHFASDVLWSAGLTYLTGLVQFWVMFVLFKPPRRVRGYYLPESDDERPMAELTSAPSAPQRQAA